LDRDKPVRPFEDGRNRRRDDGNKFGRQPRLDGATRDSFAQGQCALMKLASEFDTAGGLLQSRLDFGNARGLIQPG
jgi:hypothetical protein